MNNPPTILVGIYGHAGAGKDTAAAYIKTNSAMGQTVISSFAGNLKAACATIFSIPLHKFSDQAHKNVIDPRWGQTPRELAQYVGTELFRDNFGPDIWLHSLEESVALVTRQAKYMLLIPDVRFQNEADWIIDNGDLSRATVQPQSTKANLDIHASYVATHAYPCPRCNAPVTKHPRRSIRYDAFLAKHPLQSTPPSAAALPSAFPALMIDA